MIGKADKIIFIARIHSQIVAYINVERITIEEMESSEWRLCPQNKGDYC